ncbi:MAG: DegT/DnrJ/EryC1/StrS aminotransferase family protein [Verrucomicrobiota bacterium]|nr:DegT/DnrJ/EryC1/StrS aminotransferase family protein [Verrucomicrobiota bacterium]
MFKHGSWPLMRNNILREDLDAVIEHLKADDPILTQGENVRAFEKEWSEWLGVKYSLFVNSGSSANLLTIAALKHLYGGGEVIVPTLTWVSDISSIIHCGFDPVFVDIDMKNLGMDVEQIIQKVTSRTKAVFLTHVLGYNALNQKLLDFLKERNILLLEDVCESHGATFNGQKLGSYGFASNFSFYYAHHLSTIEGGMICTNDESFYQTVRLLRSHGMVREATSQDIKEDYKKRFPDLNPDFIFAYPAYNVRSTELNAIIGRKQLPRLDANNQKRSLHLKIFLDGLNSEKYITDFDQQGSSNYAFTLVLKKADPQFRDRLEEQMRSWKVEFRRGTAGGGNQLRQPYIRQLYPDIEPTDFPNVDHIHFYGYYIGNYPALDLEDVKTLCHKLNTV